MKKGQKHLTKRLNKEIKFMTWFFLFIGLILFLVGIYKLIYTKPRLVINARYLQQVVDDGSTITFLGVIFLVLGVYRLINYNKILKMEIEIEKDKQIN